MPAILNMIQFFNQRFLVEGIQVFWQRAERSEVVYTVVLKQGRKWLGHGDFPSPEKALQFVYYKLKRIQGIDHEAVVQAIVKEHNREEDFGKYAQ